MVKLMQQIQTGKHAAPPRLLIYGTEGIGKSTLAAQAPKPVFIQTEDGLGQIDCARFPLCKSLDEFKQQIVAVDTEQHDYKTLVIDSLDWLERLIWDDICNQAGVKSIEKVDGGYGKGYVHALTEWRKIVIKLNSIRAKDIQVIMIAHAKVERFEDPEQAAYDRYTPRLHKQAAALLTEWADIVAFATRRMRVEKNGDSGKARPIGADGGDRILRCIGSPACVAKNRYSLPNELPLSWAALAAAINGTATITKENN